MLTPEELEVLPKYIRPIYQQFEEFVIKDIARRIKKASKVTEMAQWQAERAEALGISKGHIQKELAKTLNKSEKEVADLFYEAAYMSISQENKIYQQAGVIQSDLDLVAMTPELERIVQATIKQTNKELKNFTRSLGFARIVNGETQYVDLSGMLINALDYTHFQISSGVVDPVTGIRQAVQQLVTSGVRYVDYKSGWSNKLDVAVRRAVMSGLNEMTNKMTLARMEELGAEYVEVSAHSTARPSHAAWQGQVYCYKGKDPKYPDFHEATGYGTGDGLGGWNCRHSFAPFFPGISTRAYSDADLKRIEENDNRTFEYGDKTYTAYEATQRQRRIETAMRKEKLSLLVAKETNDNEKFTQHSLKLQRLRDEYKQFSKAAGLATQNERHQLLGFDRSIAQQAVQTDKMFKKIESTLIGLKSGTGKNLKESIEINGISVHLMERMIQRTLEISDLSDSIAKPYFVTEIKYDSKDRPSQNFISLSGIVSVNPETGVIITATPTRKNIKKKILNGKEL